jgi:hypothetical protein
MTDRKSFLLRLNPKLHRVLERWASDEFRSLNSQIEYLLMDAARKSGRLPSSGETPDDADLPRFYHPDPS